MSASEHHRCKTYVKNRAATRQWPVVADSSVVHRTGHARDRWKKVQVEAQMPGGSYCGVDTGSTAQTPPGAPYHQRETCDSVPEGQKKALYCSWGPTARVTAVM
jgi:hypothetical protein